MSFFYAWAVNARRREDGLEDIDNLEFRKDSEKAAKLGVKDENAQTSR